MSQLHEKLRFLLNNKGWTQKKLAEHMCVSPDTVSSWLRGINQPRLDTVKDFCKIFDVSIQDLTNDDLDIPRVRLPERVVGKEVHKGDSHHIILDVGLADNRLLHRFRNMEGIACSAIYQDGFEVWWHYREEEDRMIRDWNERYSND